MLEDNKMEVMETFSQNVMSILEHRGWTIQQLADECKMDRSNLSKILHGRDGCTLQRAQRIADALKTPLSKLVSEKSKILSSAS